MLTFSGGNNTNSYKIEYGLTGFAIGSGKSITTSNMNVEISDLIPSTTYDIYITSLAYVAVLKQARHISYLA